MLPAIERRSGRSRYASATLSSSTTATPSPPAATGGSPTSTEISSSRFAGGSGGRLGGGRRRGARCLRAAGRRSGRDVSFLADLGLASALSSSALAVPVLDASAPDASVLLWAPVPVRFRPRPPRLPRRRLRAALWVAPASAGDLLTGSSEGGAIGALSVAARSSGDGLRRRNHRSNWKLLQG